MIRLETRNCRGLADSKKRWDVLDKIRKDNVHIACLQDVHLEKKDENKLKKEWGVQYCCLADPLQREEWLFCLAKTLNLKYMTP